MDIAEDVKGGMQFRSQIMRLDPTREQAVLLGKSVGCARFAYNWALGEWKRQAKEWWDSGKVSPFPSAFALQKQFRSAKLDQWPWVFEVSANVTESAILAVESAFEAFRAGATRYPKFKNKGSRRSFVAAFRAGETRTADRCVTLPRLGAIRFKGRLRWPESKPKKAVVSNIAGRWFVSLLYAIPRAAAVEPSRAAAGVDLGIKTPLVVASEGVAHRLGVNLSERLKHERRKLRRANKRLHRRVAGSRRHARARVLVERVHHRMANIRADVQHKATSLIAGMAKCIGIETLAVRNMMRNGRLARSIADVGFYEIRRQLRYKANEVVEAGRFYPSSKACSCCGHVKEKLTLADRTYHCDECGFECDRDENAARNLEKMAANCAVSARGARSPARKRKLALSSLALKREAQSRAQ